MPEAQAVGDPQGDVGEPQRLVRISQLILDRGPAGGEVGDGLVLAAVIDGGVGPAEQRGGVLGSAEHLKHVPGGAVDHGRLAIQPRCRHQPRRLGQEREGLFELAAEVCRETRLAHEGRPCRRLFGEFGRPLEVTPRLGAECQRRRSPARVGERLARRCPDRPDILGLGIGLDRRQVMARQHLRDLRRLLAPRVGQLPRNRQVAGLAVPARKRAERHLPQKRLQEDVLSALAGPRVVDVGQDLLGHERVEQLLDLSGRSGEERGQRRGR